MNMREAFEKWARSNDFAIQRMNANPEEYISSMTQFAWMGYAAAIESVKAGMPRYFYHPVTGAEIGPCYKLQEDV